MQAPRTHRQVAAGARGDHHLARQEARRIGKLLANFRVDDRGGLSPAKKLINDDSPSDGFTKLWELKRLDLTVEAVARRPPYSALFSPAERTKARKRLEDYGYRLETLWAYRELLRVEPGSQGIRARAG